MNKTKKKIILAAIDTFNELGLTNARNQDIAERADISLSNFNYHFGTKRELVIEVVEYMRSELSEEVYSKSSMITNDGQSLQIARAYLNFEQRFRFFYLDTHNVLQTYPELKEGLKKEIEMSNNMIKNICYLAIGKGYLKPPPAEFPDLYNKLAQQIWVNNHFLFAQATLSEFTGNYVKHGLEGIFALCYPYFTDVGIERFKYFLAQVIVEEVGQNG